MTLIELSVVILVLLGLISVLFVGATAWKRGSDRSNAILMIRSAQMGMRSHSQTQGISDPGPYPGLPSELFGHDLFVFNGIDKETGLPKANGELPDHPDLSLSFGFASGDGEVIPDLGELYMCTGGSAGVNDYSFNPYPKHYKSW